MDKVFSLCEGDALNRAGAQFCDWSGMPYGCACAPIFSYQVNDSLLNYYLVISNDIYVDTETVVPRGTYEVRAVDGSGQPIEVARRFEFFKLVKFETENNNCR